MDNKGLPFWRIALYSSASAGLNILAITIDTWLLYFYAPPPDSGRPQHLPIALIGVLMTVASIWDAAIDPFIGHWSDTLRSRWGRRRPYIFFTALPYVLAFILIFSTPFDGKVNPVALLIYFGIVIVIWEGLYTALATGYYGLLPEMFGTYPERTDVAAQMNIFQTVALILASVVPPLLWNTVGWAGMALILGIISVVPIYFAFRFLFEREDLKTDTGFPFRPALRHTFVNRSFLTAAGAQTMRFVGTGVLQAGIPFYLKYSLKVSDTMFSVIFGVAFLVAMISLYPWRNWVANRFGTRTTLILANAIMIAGVIPLSFSPSLTFTLLSAAIIGVGLGGLVLMGDVIIAEVVDEDEVRTGHQRAGMFFGMSSFLITLSGLLVSSIFGIMMPAFGYDTLLEVQPPTVDMGFRLFLSIPTTVGFLLAILLLWLYPLHGERLQAVKEALKAKRGE